MRGDNRSPSVTVVTRTYTDDELAAAVQAARSWRDVLRRLGLVATSSASIRSVRRRAELLGLDHGHFTGQRRWSEADLRGAVGRSTSWTEVARHLGLAVGSSTTVLKGHALRLGIDASHLAARAYAVDPRSVPAPSLDRLPQAGSMLAAAWFTLGGYDVSWPLEPRPYDLVVECEGVTSRVQVKTTRFVLRGTWQVKVRGSGRHGAPYDPDDLDHFFVITGTLDYFLIPVHVVAGRQVITLRSYDDFRVTRDPPRPAASPEVP
jgi:hypothetical protein